MFKFKGISSKDMQVVIEEEEHFIAKAARRYETVEIEGRDGAIFEELGYSYVERPIYVQCLNTDKIDEILAWLDGEGEFEYKDRKTTARFYSQLEPKREGYIRIIDTTFIRDPFWTKLDDEYIEVKGRKDATTEKSDNIHVEDSSNLTAKIDVFGTSSQETREGYNLLNVASSYEVTGSKAVSATLTAGTYTIKADNIVSSNKEETQFCFSVRDAQGSISDPRVPLASKKTTFTINREATKVLVYSGYNYNDSQGVTTTYTNLMIYKGTDDKEYEEYGETPSPEIKSDIENVTGDINITVCNKNLLPNNLKSTTINGITATVNEDGSIHFKGTATGTATFNLFTSLPNFLKNDTSYRLSAGVSIPQSTYLRIGDNSNNSIFFGFGGGSSYLDFTYKNNFASNRMKGFFWFPSGCVGNSYDFTIYPMLVQGTDNEEYVKHEQQAIKFSLSEGQRLADGDKLADDGIHHARKQKEFDGTENWIKNINYSTETILAVQLKMSDAVVSTSNTLCNYFKYNSDNTTVNTYRFAGNYLLIKLDVSEFPTIEAFKTWLVEKKTAETPVVVEYELAEEEIEPYTPEQQEAYNQLQNAQSYYNVTNVFTNKALLEFKYMKETTEKINNEGNIYSRPVLRLERTVCDEVDLEIEGERLQYQFNNEEYTEIDCEEKEATYEGLNRDRQLKIGYEFPKLKAGENEIKMYKGDCIIKVKRKDRWL